MSTFEPHIQLNRDLGIKYALLAGDPARVGRAAAHLEEAEELAFHREFRSIKGIYQGIPILALSTGIGGASMGIALEELHNIGITAAIRIGSSGALQSHIGLGDLILASAAVRDDGTSCAYAPLSFPAVADPQLFALCTQSVRELGIPYHIGLVRSHDSFYTDREEQLCQEWSSRGVLGADMETAALYTIAALRGIRAVSVLNNVVLYGVDAAKGISQYASGDAAMANGEQSEIQTALEAFVRLEASP